MTIYNQPWKLVPNRIRGKGGREIDKLRNIIPPIDDSTGSEAWIGSVTRVGNPPENKPDYGCAEVILPDGKQMYLYKAIELDPVQVLGKKHMEINGTGLGMLVKYLDAQDQYGLQCHPTRDWAKKMWGSDYGKEESWYVIGIRNDTDEPAYIYLGFKEGVTRSDWEEYYYKGDIKALENLCHKIQVKVGEAYFIGGGVPHALGEGCFVIEVQEPCDITLGAYPYKIIKERWKGFVSDVDEKTYNERLLGAYIYDGCNYAENLRRWRIPRNIIRSGIWGNESVVIGKEQTSYFSFTELLLNGKTKVYNTGFPQIGIVLKGSGILTFEGGTMDIKQGDEIFFPFEIPGLVAEGDMTLVLCHPEGTYQ